MNRVRVLTGPQVTHAARVGAAVALAMALLYVVVVLPFDAAYGNHLTAQVDARVADRLHDVTAHGQLRLGSDRHPPPDRDVDDSPVVLWLVGPAGKVQALTGNAPPLRPALAPAAGPVTAVLGGDAFRLQARRIGAGVVVAAESLAESHHLETLVNRAEVIVGPIFVLAMFLGSVAIGMMASRPIERARRRQLEFTADASHELRTPLTVIEAEVALALGTPRDNAAYRSTVERIGTEGKRLRHIVEDLLFLARFDSTPPPPEDEPVELTTLAEASVQRFAAVARARDTRLWVEVDEEHPALVNAPSSWVDRLCGVLIDNACRYAGPGGEVCVVVTSRGNTVSLAVEDSGPGIPPDEKPFLFDRFHRATDQGEGAGLGLAIADAVVRSTGGRWRVGSSPIGGARMEVQWRRYQAHRFAGREPAVRSKQPQPRSPARTQRVH